MKKLAVTSCIIFSMLLVSLGMTSSTPIAAQSSPPFTWVQISTQTAPNPMLLFRMNYDAARSKTVLFGGWYWNSFYNDTWEYDGTNWTLKNPSTRPCPRYTHAMTYDSGRQVMVMFGGHCGGTQVNDTWEYDGNNWTQKHPANSPSPRSNPSLAYDTSRGVAVLFGGCVGNLSSGCTNNNETWEYDGNSWTQKHPANSPPARWYADMAYDPNRDAMVLFGGEVSPGVLGYDTWEYDGSNWVQKADTPSLPSACVGFTYDSAREKIVLSDGAQTWDYDGTNWTQLNTATPPAPRGCAGFVYDSSRQRFVLFGGNTSGGLMNDTWELVDSAPPTTTDNSPAGWQQTDFIVSLICTDNPGGSGCKETKYRLDGGAWQTGNSVSISTEGDHLLDYYSTDYNGNVESTKSTHAKLDKTKPMLNPLVSPNPVLLNGSAIATSGAQDSLSGIQTESCGLVDTSTVGNRSVACTATDKAGNSNSASATYNVIYNFGGFFPPVDNPPVLNLAKAGRAVPVKFSLAGDRGLDIFAAGYPASQRANCDTTVPVDEIVETVTAGGSSLSYDADSGQYNYVWKTDKAWAGTCRQLIVRLNDGTDHVANFKFR